MHVIFLDIDGVLNAYDDWKGINNTPSNNGYLGISSPKIRRLKRLVEFTDSKIVLTSSWKIPYVYYMENYTKNILQIDDYEEFRFGKYLRDKMRRFGLDIYDTTFGYELSASGFDRGKGIKNYLKKHHEIDKWIVLDDETFPDYDQDIYDHLFRTSEETGLDEDIMNKITEWWTSDTK